MASKTLSALLLACAVCCRGGEQRVQTPTNDVAVPDAAPVPSPLDPPALHVLLDDPRFAEARRKEREHDWAGAAQAIHDTRTDDCAALYVEGRMRMLAQDARGAAEAFDRASEDRCLLASYAAFRAAQAWGKQGRADEAIARAKRALASPEPIAFADDAALVLADAEDLKGDRAHALELRRASIAAHPKGARWVDTEVRIASAILDGVGGDPSAHMKEAIDALTRVVVEAPQLADVSGAAALRVRAIALMPSAKDLSVADRAKLAQALLDQGKIADAKKTIDQAIPLAKGDHTGLCKLHTLRAQAVAKTKNNAADAWGEAIASCAAADPRGDALAHALYNGAKSSWSNKRDREALDRFARIEREFPDHRLADDARFLAALVHRDAGELAEFAAMMGKLPDDYPKGDMRGEALFRLALEHLVRGDTTAAEAALARGGSIDAGNHHWASAGRFAYFAARLKQQKGDIEGAKAGYAAVVHDHPMQFYMFLAYARLSAIDPALAKKALDDLDGEPPGRILTREHEEMKKPAFARAIALLEVGEIDAAKKEMASSGATSESADSELVYTIADLFVRAGAPEVAVSWSRARITDHLSHPPSGRWRRAWETAYPRAYEDAVRKGASDASIPLSLVWAIMREESGFYADAKSPTGALGLMQLMPSTAKQLARTTSLPFDEEALKRPDVSIGFGTTLLHGLRATYARALPLAIAAYNAGSGAVMRWLAQNPADFDLWVEQIPFEETRGYVKRVIASQGTYAFLYARNELAEVLGLPERVTKP